MIEIPQNDENEDQKFLNVIKKNENPDMNTKKINIRKSIYLIIIFIILISSFILKDNNSLNTIEKISEINNTNKKSYLSIIINSFKNDNNLNSLIHKVLSYNIDNSEIIISTNYLSNTKLSENQIENIKKKNISLKYLKYGENTNTVKMRLDSALKSTGDYLIYIDPENPSLSILNSYKSKIKENIDIIHYEYNFYHIEDNKIIYQPQIFESLFFEHDSINYNHFHIVGKIYKREMFTKAAKNLNKLYFEQGDKYFDEMIIVSLVFKEANTFIKYSSNSNCDKNKCQRENLFKNIDYNKKILKDAILFIKFLFEYTGKDKVQEKRMAVRVFKDLIIAKRVRSFHNSELLRLIHDTIDLYLNSELINDLDKEEILKYKKSLRK